MSEYPEHEKLKLISDKSQAIGEFLAWLESGGLHAPPNEAHETESYGSVELAYRPELCGGPERSDELWPLSWSKQRLLAAYFEIDLDKIEDEKRAMLE